MLYLEVLSHVFSVVLTIAITIFLAFSPGMAKFVTHIPEQKDRTAEVVKIPEENPPLPSSIFETFSDTVRAQLHTDTRYQQASVAQAVPPTVPLSTTAIEAALVNIFCTTRAGGTIHTITGSGAFIGERGVILTNAHIAQFLLLGGNITDTHAQCIIRQGNPAQAKYEAELLYVSPAWITKNAHQLYAEKPSGTGENDFALLYVTGALAGQKPDTFPVLVPAPREYLFNQMEVRAAGYPAEILTADNTMAPIAPVIATTSITHLFTFGSGDIDLVAIAPSTVGQQGSSGGPILDADGDVVGLITTRGNSAEEGIQSLRALALSYVERMLIQDTGLTLTRTITGDIPLRAKVFNEATAPYLRELYLDTL